MENIIQQQNDGHVELELLDGQRIKRHQYQKVLRLTVKNSGGEFSTVFLDKYNVGRVLVEISNIIGEM